MDGSALFLLCVVEEVLHDIHQPALNVRTKDPSVDLHVMTTKLYEHTRYGRGRGETLWLHSNLAAITLRVGGEELLALHTVRPMASPRDLKPPDRRQPPPFLTI